MLVGVCARLTDESFPKSEWLSLTHGEVRTLCASKKFGKLTYGTYCGDVKQIKYTPESKAKMSPWAKMLASNLELVSGGREHLAFPRAWSGRSGRVGRAQGSGRHFLSPARAGSQINSAASRRFTFEQSPRGSLSLSSFLTATYAVRARRLYASV